MTQNEDKILKIIKNSGNDFHLKVVGIFENINLDLDNEQQWVVEVSPYYNDPTADKPREIDIIAERIFEDKAFRGNSEKLKVRLFIECKYINKPVVFWFREKNFTIAENLAKDNDILNREDNLYLKNESVIPNVIHHYIKDNEIVKLFSGEKDIFYTAINQALNALIFFDEHRDSTNVMNYPIIVVNSFDNLYRRVDSDNGYVGIDKNFQIEVYYSYKNVSKENVTKYFLIDVVSLDNLNEFLDQLEKNDITILKKKLVFDQTFRKRQEEPFSPFDCI